LIISDHLIVIIYRYLQFAIWPFYYGAIKKSYVHSINLYFRPW